jgi:hypothetical protein
MLFLAVSHPTDALDVLARHIVRMLRSDSSMSSDFDLSLAPSHIQRLRKSRRTLLPNRRRHDYLNTRLW